MLSKFNNYIISLLALLMIFISSANASLTPSLENAVNQYNETGIDSVINVVVFLNDDNNNQNLKDISNNQTESRATKIKRVLNYLNSNKQISKSSALTNRILKNKKSYWIIPAFSCEINISQLDSLASLSNVTKVVENALLDYIKPVDGKASASRPQLSTSVSSQLSMLNVPKLWANGINGKGSLVCSFDTGVEGTHPALSSKWRGNSESVTASWFSKDNPDAPIDNIGHGTHTMGIMVGSVPSDSFGVAPGAEWISAGVVDQGRTLNLTLAEIIEAFQWALNPDGDINTTDDVPDVILNSWGIPNGLFEPCDDMFNGVISACEAAGIVTIFASGNEGPTAMSLRHPADLALTPVNNFSVGAVDNYKVIAEFSSRGPSSCDKVSIKPEVVAPGISIRSSFKGGGYFVMSGTSMAAPYVAGVVALLRQAYPNATVAEIKNAIMLTANDLGILGEDNDYGYGLVDAEAAYGYLSGSLETNMIIASTGFVNQEVILPDDTVEFQIVLHNSASNTEFVTGRLSPINQDLLSMLNDQSEFYFGLNSSNTVNSDPFTFVLNGNLYNGQEIEFELLIQSGTSKLLQTIPVSVTVGYDPPGKILTHDNNNIKFSVSDFGQFGFASGSIYNTEGDGFNYQNKGNILYEAGIMISSQNNDISNSIRGENGEFVPTDFTPVTLLTDGSYAEDGGYHRTCSFNDQKNSALQSLMIKQETIHFESLYDNNMIFVKYFLINDNSETYQDISFAFMADFDLPGLNESVSYSQNQNLIYQQNGSGQLVGLAGIKNIENFVSIVNSANSDRTKVGLTDSAKISIVKTQGAEIDNTLSGDMMFTANTTPFTLLPGDSIEISFALVVAESESELIRNASAAIVKYGLLTDVPDCENDLLPKDFILNQNYPNPFNPRTTISFSLNRAIEVKLSVYNMLGQKVTTLHSGYLNSGVHSYEWDGTNSNAETAASGIYFYRLETTDYAVTKKMLLIK